MILSAGFGERAGRKSGELQGEVDRLQKEVLESYKNLVELENSASETDQENVVTAGLAKRLLSTLESVRVELATDENQTLARREHNNELKADLKSLEEGVKRLSASMPSDETPGDKRLSFVGSGNRQYLTGLKVGGRRILVLVDTSASMLGETIVNVVRRRNLSDEVKSRARKWQQAIATVNWLATQIPPDSSFQVYAFNTNASAVVSGTDGTWLNGGEREDLEKAVHALERVVPEGGTNLYQAFKAIGAMRPTPDNVFLLTDGLPTQGRRGRRRSTVSGKERSKLFNEALSQLSGRAPVNVILFPMEGDPLAPSAFWKLAISSGGAYVSPSKDWP